MLKRAPVVSLSCKRALQVVRNRGNVRSTPYRSTELTFLASWSTVSERWPGCVVSTPTLWFTGTLKVHFLNMTSVIEVLTVRDKLPVQIYQLYRTVPSINSAYPRPETLGNINRHQRQQRLNISSRLRTIF